MNETETHLSVEELAAYHAGELPKALEADVQNHLVACSECTRMLLDLDALRRGTDPADEAPDAEKEAFWQTLRPRLPLPSPPRQEGPGRSSPRQLRVFQLLAAVLAAAVIGLGVQAASLRRTIEDLAQPNLNAPVRDLSATSTRGTGTGAPVVISLAPDDRFFTLVLSPVDPRDFPDHEVVLARGGGSEVWRGRGLRKNRYNTFSLILARRQTGDGSYVLRVFGIESRHKELVGEYHFRIETQRLPR